jgi:nitroreductase
VEAAHGNGQHGLAVEAAIRTRRTHKSFHPDPIPRETLEELFDLARFAPNHHLSQPWRFRVVGPETLAKLKELGGPGEAVKLDRAPTLVLVSAVVTGELVQDEEDVCATACAAYIVLLSAHARGLAGYWRSPAVVRGKPGREALGVEPGERVLGLLHLGGVHHEPPTRERDPAEAFVTYLE